MFEPDPRILVHPNIPKPLHGIAPRVILGKEWWDLRRKEAYASTCYHCLACGIHVNAAAFYHWLEAHECFDYDTATCTLRLTKIVPLCHACHNFIHDGRMQMMLRRGEMTRDKHAQIIEHGTTVLRRAGLVVAHARRHNVKWQGTWKDFRMEIEGQLYGPSSPSFEDWERGVWRNWKPEPNPR